MKWLYKNNQLYKDGKAIGVGGLSIFNVDDKLEEIVNLLNSEEELPITVCTSKCKHARIECQKIGRCTGRVE